MSKPTGKLLFAYQTIADLEVERDTLRTANQRLEGEVARLRKLLIRVHKADALSHNCPLWKSVDAALSTANGEVTE